VDKIGHRTVHFAGRWLSAIIDEFSFKEPNLDVSLLYKNECLNLVLNLDSEVDVARLRTKLQEAFAAKDRGAIGAIFQALLSAVDIGQRPKHAGAFHAFVQHALVATGFKFTGYSLYGSLQELNIELPDLAYVIIKLRYCPNQQIV
jgi:hypothetical protein